MTKNPSSITLWVFIGMTCALVASVRNIPILAATGWTMIFYMFAAVLFFALPISLIAGEYAGMFPGAGGPELWVTSALGEKWGFVTSWLLWVQMFPGMVMVASVLSPTLATAINMPDLAQNSMFTFICIIAIYWLVTILNFKFDMAGIVGKFGVWLGLYFPMAILFGLGFAALITLGINPEGQLAAFDVGKLVPDSETIGTLKFLVPILFILTGIEMSSVYMTRLDNPVKTYIRGLLIALFLMAAFNVINGFLLANAVTGDLELNNIAQGLAAFCQILGLPLWIVNVFCVMVFIGVVVQLSAWATGPSKTITQSARRGLYPPKFGFWKTNSRDVSVSVLVVQATVISLFALLYLLIPTVNAAFLLLVSATAIIYSTVYVIMGIGIVKLRKAQPDLERPFRIGKNPKSNTVIWIVVGIFLAIVFGGLIASLIESGFSNAFIELGISALLFIIPLIIFKRRKQSWAEDVKKQLTES